MFISYPKRFKKEITKPATPSINLSKAESSGKEETYKTEYFLKKKSFLADINAHTKGPH